VRRGIDYYAVLVSGLQHLETTAIHLVLAARPVKIVAAYISPTRPLIDSDLAECLSGGFPVLMASDLKAKHMDWNSRLTTARVSLVRDYANRNTRLIFTPDAPTTVPYTHNATPDVLDIVVVKEFVLPVLLSICSAQHPDDTRMDWAAFQACLDDRHPGNPVVNDEEAIEKRV
jgi:hypothetical protein